MRPPHKVWLDQIPGVVLSELLSEMLGQFDKALSRRLHLCESGAEIWL